MVKRAESNEMTWKPFAYKYHALQEPQLPKPHGLIRTVYLVDDETRDQGLEEFAFTGSGRWTSISDGLGSIIDSGWQITVEQAANVARDLVYDKSKADKVANSILEDARKAEENMRLYFTEEERRALVEELLLDRVSRWET